MRVNLLGQLELRGGDHLIDLGPPQTRAVFILLALNANQFVTVDQTIDALWEAHPPSSAAHAVRVHASRLKKALDEDAATSDRLVTRPDRIGLRLSHHEVDACRFEAFAVHGKRALEQGFNRSALKLLTRAEKLWRGDALVDVAYAAFAQADIRRLNELHAAAMEDRIEALVGVGRLGAAIADLRAMTTASPARERPWQLLVLALSANGRSLEALAAAQEGRSELQRVYGTAATSALKSVEAQVARELLPSDGSQAKGPTAVPARRHGPR